ncbi:hypothetical protein ACE3HA_23495, partial [Enterobacter cancerogenus]
GFMFAGLRQNGAVVAWGGGGSVPADIAALRDIVAVTGSFGAFAGLRQDGSVVAWGDSSYGGSVPADIAALRDIRAVYASWKGFIVLTDAGAVYSWGDAGDASVLAGRISYQLPDRARIRRLRKEDKPA